MEERDGVALYESYSADLVAYLTYKTGCRDTASDLLQETFVRYLQAVRISDVKDPGSFLFTIARNLVIDHVRKAMRRQIRPTPVAVLDARPSETPSVERMLEARKRLSVIFAALDDLSPRAAQVFRLSRIEGMSYRQIADILEISESTVQKDLTRALEHLTERAGLD